MLRTHALASSIMFSVFCFVSFIFMSLVVIIIIMISAVAVDGMHSMWVMRGAREQSRRRAYLQSVCEPDEPAASRPTASQWPATRARSQAFCA